MILNPYGCVYEYEELFYSLRLAFQKIKLTIFMFLFHIGRTYALSRFSLPSEEVLDSFQNHYRHFEHRRNTYSIPTRIDRYFYNDSEDT